MNQNVLNILDELYPILKAEQNVSLYRNSKKIFSSNTATTKTKLNSEINDAFNNPSKNIKVFQIVYGINKKWKPSNLSFGPVTIICNQFTLTPDLEIKQLSDDGGQTITYTTEELETRRFHMTDVLKIIKAVKNKTISFVPGKKVTITDVLNSLKPLKRTTKRKTTKKK
jgi:hypothetical protein